MTVLDKIETAFPTSMRIESRPISNPEYEVDYVLTFQFPFVNDVFQVRIVILKDWNEIQRERAIKRAREALDHLVLSAMLEKHYAHYITGEELWKLCRERAREEVQKEIEEISQ